MTNYPLYIFFGILPSFLWLQFYLRRDVRPEPKLMILKIFFYGMLATLPAIFLETAIFGEMGKLNFSGPIIDILTIFLGAALVEESLKFLVVKEKVLHDPEFDEPVDAMIYMIVAALGFAAAENILILFPLQSPLFKLTDIFQISLLRFLGATFLHALCSAVVGFFIGLSFLRKDGGPQMRTSPKGGGKLIFVGLIIAIFLHGLYNFSIIKIEGNLRLLIPSLILIFSAIFVSFGFKWLRKIAKK
jgi:RsiW-degrading membrane proteinase PrsW (M82 family)